VRFETEEDFIGRVISGPLPGKPSAEPSGKPQRAKGTARRKFLVLNQFWCCPGLSELSPTAKLVWLYLWSRADARMTCFPSMKRIAERVGCSRRHARRAIRDLELRGFLRTRIGGPRPDVKVANFYRLLVPKGPKGWGHGCPKDGDMGVPPFIDHESLRAPPRAEGGGVPA